MKKIILVVLAMAMLTLYGCGNSDSKENETTKPTASNSTAKGLIPIHIEILPQAQATSTKTTGKLTAMLSTTDVALRQKIDHVIFFTVGENYQTINIGSIPVVNGVASGTLSAEVGNYNLQAFCMSKGNVQLYYAYQDITVESQQATPVNLIFKRHQIVWMSAKLKNVAGAYLFGHQYRVEIDGLGSNSYSSGDDSATIDPDGAISFTNAYLVDPSVSEVKITVTDENNIRRSATYTFDLLADLNESDTKGYAEKIWPAPGTITINSLFEEDGNLVKADFASGYSVPSRQEINASLARVNLTNSTDKTVVVKNLTVTVWDVRYMNGFHLSYQGSVDLPVCSILSQDQDGQAKLTCPVEISIAAGAITTFHLRGNIGDYPTTEMLSVSFTDARIVDNNGNGINFSGVGPMATGIN